MKQRETVAFQQPACQSCAPEPKKLGYTQPPGTKRVDGGAVKDIKISYLDMGVSKDCGSFLWESL